MRRAFTAAIFAMTASALGAVEPVTRSPDPRLDYLVSKRSQTVERLARVLLSEGKTAEARALLEPESKRVAELPAGEPVSLDDLRLVYLLGVVEEMSGSPAKRDAQFALARKRTPPDERSHYLLGRAFEEMHREDIARFEYAAVLNTLPADSPLDALALEQTASLEQTNRRWAAAAGTWGKLARLLGAAPDSFHEQMARMEIDSRVRLAQAVEYASLVATGWMLFEDGKPEDRAGAMKACESAWRIDPEAVEACVLGERLAAASPDAATRDALGAAWRQRSDYALATLRSRIAQDPRNPLHYNALAWFCAELGRNVTEGLGAAGRALELRPADPALLDTLAEIQFRSGDPAAAVVTIGRVVDLSPYANDYYRRQLDRFESAAKKAGAP